MLDFQEAVTKAGLAFAYHRTNPDNVESIVKKGFKPGWGAMYGKGWYMCFNLESQLKSGMLSYGNSLIKSRINLDNVLIFNYQISKMIYGDNGYTLVKQLLKFGSFPMEGSIPTWLLRVSKNLEETFQNPFISADMAYNEFVCKAVNVGASQLPIFPGIKGLLFSGRTDGDVIVIYAVNSAIPMSVCMDTSMAIEGGEEKLKWTSVLDVKNIQKAKMTDELMKLFKGKIHKLETKLDLATLKREFPWFFSPSNAFSAASITIDDDKNFIWHAGTWTRGELKDVIWVGGRFLSGKFSGKFLSGVFECGNFLDGEFGLPSATAGALIAKYEIDPYAITVFNKGTWTKGIWHSGEWTGKAMIMYKGRPTSSKYPPNAFFSQKDQEELDRKSKLPSLSAQPQTASVETNELKKFFYESFFLHDLTPEAQQEVYDEFANSYQKATGAAWDVNHFFSRASNWVFYGTEKGGIAVRPQASGLTKLVATFGGIREIIRAYHEMETALAGKPVWGVMTDDLGKMFEKISAKKFKRPPALFVKTLVPHIKNIFGDTVYEVKSDGGIVVDTPAGKMTKYFYANREYFYDILDKAKDQKLPIPGPVMTVLVGILKVFVKLF